MSEFLGYFSDVMDIGVTPEDWQAEFKSVVTGTGWRVMKEEAGILDLLPPVDEPIGNDLYYEFLRVKFNADSTEFVPCLFATENAPSIGSAWRVYFYTNFTYNRTLVINGVEVSVDSSAATSYEELGLLWVAALLNEPQLSGVMKDVISLPESNNVTLYLISDNGLPIDLSYIGNNSYANINHIGLNSPNSAVIEATTFLPGATVESTPLGFVYYMTVRSRSIMVGIKSGSGFTGPVYSGYGDNEIAVSLTPDGCAPIELVVANYQNVNTITSSYEANMTLADSSGGNPYISHLNGFVLYDGHTSVNYTASTNTPALWYEDLRTKLPISFKEQLKLGSDMGFTMIGAHNLSYRAYTPKITGINMGIDLGYYGSNLVQRYARNVVFNGEPSIQSSVLWGREGVMSASSNANEARSVFTAETKTFLDDAYFFDAPDMANESLSVTQEEKVGELTAGINSEADTIHLSGTEKLPDGGTIFINDELITYDGISENSLLNCVRGAYGTNAAEHDLGADIHAGGWYLKINYGALYTGNVRPS